MTSYPCNKYEQITPSYLLSVKEQRYKSDQRNLSKLKPLKKLKENITDQEFKECHQSIIADKCLAEFGLQYKEAASVPELNTAENPTDLLTLLLRSSKSGDNMDVLITALARVIVAKPHSADVERLIKSYNVVKTIERSSMSSETLRSYLYIRHNMPVVSEFGPRPAVLAWIQEKERRNVTPVKWKEQKCFSSMFEEARLKSLEKQQTQSDKVSFQC